MYPGGEMPVPRLTSLGCLINSLKKNKTKRSGTLIKPRSYQKKKGNPRAFRLVPILDGFELKKKSYLYIKNEKIKLLAKTKNKQQYFEF